jgi:hypothetical protein
MVRYSFLVGLFHPRLHAGLSRRLRLLNAARLGNPLESRIMLPSRDREGVVADSFSSLSTLKMAYWLLARSHFHGSIVSRKLMYNPLHPPESESGAMLWRMSPRLR